MKWPKWMLLIRHDVSAYNSLKNEKSKDPVYQEFLKCFRADPTSEKTKDLAKQIHKKFALGVGDADTSLFDYDAKSAEEVGIGLSKEYDIPDVIFVSPYTRTQLTLRALIRGWTKLEKVKIIEDERIREQEHGLSLIYNDWRVFHTLHPEQRILHKLEGPYWYRYPQGENVPDVRARNRSWITTVVRDFSEKKVLVVTHHLNILSIRAHIERWNAEKFIDVNKNDKPINCGVTAYQGNPNEGENGKFELMYYNRCLYDKK